MRDVAEIGPATLAARDLEDLAEVQLLRRAGHDPDCVALQIVEAVIDGCDIGGGVIEAAIALADDGRLVRQIRNFAAILLVSQGVPMIGMGDEVRRTQGGNNNAYCQDNEIGWFDWTLVEKHAGMLRYWQRMIAFRRQHPTIHRPRYFNGMVNARGLRDLSWHGCDGAPPNWGDPDARAVAFTLGGQGQDADIHVIMNMYWEPLSFVLPDLNGRVWRRAVDTSLPSPDDIAEPGHETPVAAGAYRAGPRSIAILIAPAG